LVNLVASYFRGAPAGPDPWHGATLEWTIPSPPPEYNFAVIPKVSSAYANWDYADREEDRRKLADGIMVLEQGHEQPVSSPVDGWWAEIVEMPHDSPWPILLALAMSIVFILLLIHLWVGACFAASGIALVLLGWHGVVPLILVGVLATTSLPMQLAARAVRRGRLWATRALLVWALVVQCGYLAYELHDYLHQLHRSTPQDSAYGSIYYTLLGADHAHVAVGILLVVWLLWKLARGLTTYRLNAVQVVAFYWHAVNVLTLIVTGVLLSARV